MLHYKGTPFHRVVEAGFVQGGDVAGGHGDGGVSSFVGDARPEGALAVPEGFVDPTSKQGCFADEHLKLSHASAGVVGMAGSGVPNSNASQFYVTLRSLPALDGKAQAVGRVVSGLDALEEMSKVKALNERPVDEWTVLECGEFKPPEGSAASAGEGGAASGGAAGDGAGPDLGKGGP